MNFLPHEKEQLFRFIAQYETEKNPATLNVIMRLEKLFPQFSKEFIRAISETIYLRPKLEKKMVPNFPWFTSIDRLEQATSYSLAEFHAKLIKRTGITSVIDATTGCGLDSLAFIQQGFEVISYEIDHATFERLSLNKSYHQLKLWELKFGTYLNHKEIDSFVWYFDPMRRNNTVSKITDLEQMNPPLQEILKKVGPNAPLLIKSSPLLKITPQLKSQFNILVVSLGGECKEILLTKHIPNLPTGKMGIYFADAGILYDEGDTIQLTHSNDEKKLFIYEPDPALSKSGLADKVAYDLDLRKPGADFGYFLGINQNVEPFFTKYQLIDPLPHKLSEINYVLREFSGIREVIFKKRQSLVNLDILQKKFKLKKKSVGDPLLVFISTENNKSVFYY